MKGQSLGFSFTYYLIHCQAQHIRFVALEILQNKKSETCKYTYLFSIKFWRYNILWMALFSLVPIFGDWTKITQSLGSKFVVIVFSLKIQKITISLVLEFMDLTLQENHEKLVPHEI